jgi:hypothetical protein
MNHPYHIEYAAADRHAADLKAGSEAQRLRAARDELIVHRRFARLLARIRRLFAAPPAPVASDPQLDELLGEAPAPVR